MLLEQPLVLLLPFCCSESIQFFIQSLFFNIVSETTICILSFTVQHQRCLRIVILCEYSEDVFQLS